MDSFSTSSKAAGPICSYNEATGKREMVLLFRCEELLYDIRNAAYIEGHVMPTDTPTHVQHTVQDVGEEGNVDRVSRILSLSVAQCRELLYPYTNTEIERTELNDKLREPGVYGIVMNVPTDFSQTTLSLLEKLIHEYIVCKAVADWMSITNPAKAETWAAKAADMESEIRVSLHSRRIKTRRRLHPF